MSRLEGKEGIIFIAPCLCVACWGSSCSFNHFSKQTVKTVQLLPLAALTLCSLLHHNIDTVISFGTHSMRVTGLAEVF